MRASIHHFAFLATTAHALPHNLSPLTTRQIPSTCDLEALSTLALPASTLPAPAANLFLSTILLGRGVQNYTCDPADPTSAPVANGAVAVLYDASCVGLSSLETLAGLTGECLPLALPEDPFGDFLVGSQGFERGGHHFFNAGKVPVFDLSEEGGIGGVGLMGVFDKVPGPTDATKDVPWLRLGSVEGTVGGIRGIYRVETRGGVAPGTCEGVEGGEVSVQYSAQYWVYEEVVDEAEEVGGEEDGGEEEGGEEEGGEEEGGEEGEEEDIPGAEPVDEPPASVPATPLEPATPVRPRFPPGGGRPWTDSA